MAGVADILEQLDVARFRAGWGTVLPGIPQPETDAEVIVTMHMARTQSDAVIFGCRAYSHSWLLDHGFESQLPDHLKPRAERIYPVKAYAVGIAVKSAGSGKFQREAAKTKEGFLERAVMECDADGRLLDRDHVLARMAEARKQADQFIYG